MEDFNLKDNRPNALSHLFSLFALETCQQGVPFALQRLDTVIKDMYVKTKPADCRWSDTDEPRYNEGPGDCQNMFMVLFHMFCYYWGEEYRSLLKTGSLDNAIREFSLA